MSSTMRTLLFVPANRPDRFGKALASNADAVILDLEDAVPPDDKGNARNAAAAWLNADRNVFLRINGADTPWFRDDLALAKLPGIAGIMLPKAERIDEVFQVSCVGAGTPVLPMIESAVGLASAGSIARAQGVKCLVFGSIDFQLDMGLNVEDAELSPYRAQLLLASRLAGIEAPIDGVSTSIDDMESLRAESQRSRRQGFSGKLCIHPRQVDVVNECFAPSESDLAWALRVLEASKRSGGAAISVDGKMVDRPVMMRAQAVVKEVAERNLRAAARKIS
jgi:citrate lyase subunit beta/citryl-CoA lyase